MPGLSGTRKLVRFIRKAHHHCRNLAILQRTKHRLTTRTSRRPVVSLAEDQHQRRLHLVDVSDRRTPAKVFRILERRRLEPRRLKQREVSRVPPVSPVRDVALRNGRRETRRLS